ncbi:TolC family protein [Pedobacter sp. HMWF019]|uniref:TolC family protein n=1 Tax=Pedobacter sp. HMWF019 TaxID=2056856 RepID=UPI000D3547E3|nr:TolC family protein [Pedobacter sp. HMWF019]PTT02927.1 TolC family protein [Pedobacter sp. HMWF019]
MKIFTSSPMFTGLSIVLSVAFTTGFVQKSTAQEVITIQEAIDKTLNGNLQVKQSKLNEDLSEENLGQSKYAILPTLNSSNSYNVNFGRSLDQSTYTYNNRQFSSYNGGLTSNVTLFQGLQKLNQIKQNKLLLAADKTNTEKIKNDLILQVITAYLQILYNKDLLKAADQQLAVSKQQLDVQQQLLDVGNKTLADLSQAKSQLATSELNKTNAENALTISYLTLAQLMEIPSSSKYEVQAPVLSSFNKPSTNYNPDQVYDNALTFFPDIKLASIKSEAAKKGIDVAKGSYYPTLTFGGSLASNFASTGTRILPGGIPDPSAYHFFDQIKDNFGQSFGFSLAIPIFNGFQARSNVRKARINYLQNQTQEQLAKNNLSKVIYQAVADLKAAEGRYSSTTNTFLAQKDAFHVIEQRYAVGLVNSLDYSTSQTNMNKAEIDMIQAKYDLLFRAKVIDYYLGKQIIF